MHTGIDGWKRTMLCGEVTEQSIGQEVCLMGWVQRSRNLGSLIFTDLRDHAGIVQVVFDQQDGNEALFALGEALSREYVVAVRGTVAPRAPEALNPRMKTGQVEVRVREARLLNRAQTPPIYIQDDVHEDEAVRLTYRYLDLRRPKLQSNLRKRARVVSAVRRYLDSQGFVDVETPILTKSTPEGARDFLVPSRQHPGQFYALPQSPQIYKQLLMVANLDRYYQLARCFRDEDNRADRQPEFTQVDLEMSFVTPEDIQSVVEGAFAQVLEEVEGVALSLPLPRITWRQAMEQYGSDKPDRRFAMCITDVSETVKDCGFSVFENTVAGGGTVRGLCAKGAGERLSRKEIDALGEFVKTYRAKGLAWAVVGEDGGAARSSFAKFLSKEAFASLAQALKAGPGDALFLVADTFSTAVTALGQLRLRLARQLSLVPEGVYDLFWVTEFPLLEWDEEAGRFQAMHHPFTSPLDADLEKMETDPGAVRANAYDLVFNGVEMGSGSIRIHQCDLQERMFALLGMSKEEAREKFGFLLEAFKYGTPPHGGFAFGVDRLLMLLTGDENLRDVIAFPKVQNASDPMMDTPSQVSPEQLSMLGIQVETE